MKASEALAVAVWLLVVSWSALNILTISPQTFLSGAQLPWPIVLTPIVVVVGAFLRGGHPGELVLGRWVDGRLGQGVYYEFMSALRLELLFAVACLDIVLIAVARNFLFNTSVFPSTVIGFFSSGGVAFLIAHYVRRARKDMTFVPSSMTKPTPMQRYYLFQIAWMRWFGAVFAVAAVLITASNLPWLIRSRDLRLIATNLGGGAVFFLIGLALYLIGAAVQRRYRAHITQ